MKMNLKNENLLWKYNMETGRPMYCRLATYISSTASVFIGAFGANIVGMFMDGEAFTKQLMLQQLVNAGRISLVFLAILYCAMAIIGWYLFAEGDFITKHIYSAITRRRIARDIKTIPTSTESSQDTYSAIFPACILVCERIEIKNGFYKRIPMILNSYQLIENGKAVFDAKKMQSMFCKEYVFNGTPAESVVHMFNLNNCDKSTKELLRNCDGLAVIEFSMVCDKSPLSQNNRIDNLLRIQIRSVPCTTNYAGKLCIVKSQQNPKFII